MLATMDDYTKHSWLLGAEAFETVRSYSASAADKLRSAVEEAGPRLITDDIELPYEAFFETMPESHRRFFRGLRLFHKRMAQSSCTPGSTPKVVRPRSRRRASSRGAWFTISPRGIEGRTESCTAIGTTASSTGTAGLGLES